MANDSTFGKVERTVTAVRSRVSTVTEPVRELGARVTRGIDNRVSERTLAVIGVLVALALFAVPQVAPNDYYIDVLIRMFQFAVLAQSFNIIAGYAGLFSLGHVAFYGLGAYTAVLLQRAGSDPVITILAGGVVGVLVSVPVGLISITATGIYFALVTLALAEIFRVFFLENWQVGDLTTIGGSSGEILSFGSWSSGEFYYVFLLILLVVIVATYHLDRSMLGLNFELLREDETLARSFGVNVRKYKLVAFAISAFFPGVIGSTFALYSGYVVPGTVFNVSISVGMQVQAILGGLGTVLGPILGALSLIFLEETVTQFAQIKDILYGLLMIVLMLYMPGGLLSLFRR